MARTEPIFGFAIKADGKVPFVCSAGVSQPNHVLIVSAEYRKQITTGFTPEEVEANARLIAAAPELLEAVKETLLWLGNLQVFGANLSLGEEGDEKPYLERLADAIAKAEGRDA